MSKLIAVACLLLCTVGNAQTKPTYSNDFFSRRPLGWSVTLLHTCDEVLGAALTTPGAQEAHHRVGLAFHPDGSPAIAPFALTVPFDGQDTPPGEDTLVEMWPGVPNDRDLKGYAAMGVSVTKDQEICWMDFPMPYPFPFNSGRRDKRGVIVFTQKQMNEQKVNEKLAEKVDREERDWVCKVGALLPGFKCQWSGEKRAAGSDPEFQKSSMEELKRIAADAGY